MKLHYIILFLGFSWFNANGQALLKDSLKAQFERQEYSFIIIPAHYEKLYLNLNLSEAINSDSLSLRLWTSNMMGYNLITFENKNAQWETYSYNYLSDTLIRKTKLNPKFSTFEFLKKILVFDFDSFISQYQIKNFTDNVDDGTWFTLEIIKEKKYKVLQYHSPASFKDIDNKKFTDLLKLLNSYF